MRLSPHHYVTATNRIRERMSISWGLDAHFAEIIAVVGALNYTDDIPAYMRDSHYITSLEGMSALALSGQLHSVEF